MNRTRIHCLRIALLAVGLTAWGMQTNRLYRDGKFAKEHNVLHLKQSPFGRTLSLAMRGPVDVYWHRGEPHEHPPGEEHPHDHAHGHAHGHTHEPGLAAGDDPELDYLVSLLEEDPHECAHEECKGEACDHGHEPPIAANEEFPGVRPYLLERIEAMRTAYNSRSNRTAESPRHKAYIMGEMERKLAVGYDLDPSNLAAYGAYFLFKSEALARVEGQSGEDLLILDRRREAHTLAHRTLQYCWRFPAEAPAMITGASAAHDCLQMLSEHPEPDMHLAQSYLQRLGLMLQQYETIRQAMMENNTWEDFPAPRRAEMEKTHSLIRALQRADLHYWNGHLTRNTPGAQPGPGSGS
ncbi:MAG: hypothetical protein MK194_02075 [Roseibacillus sp.]|nr:hypothetical protein [Roseibacillus sp.]